MNKEIFSMLALVLRRWTKKKSKPVKQVMGGSDKHHNDSSPAGRSKHPPQKQQTHQQEEQNNSTENHVSDRTSNPAAESNNERTSSSSTTTSSSSSSSSSSVNSSSSTQQEAKPNVIKKKQRCDFRFGKILGEGSYSEVVLATEIHTGKQYAIKVLEKRHIVREKKDKYVFREREVLTKLNHPFFVKLYFTFQDTENLYFGLSLAKKGELLPYIQKLGSFDENASRFYAAEIVLALEHLHSLGIIHRDLKPENILLNEDMHIQITDFGTAKCLDANAREVRANSFVGTAQYVSPELLTEKSATKSSDLWALGAILYQLLAGLPPFRAGNEYMIFQKIIKLEYEFPEGFPPKAKDLVSKLLILDPHKRIGCAECGGYPELKAHPFFEGIDWENLHLQTPPALKPCMIVDGEEIHSDFYMDDFDLSLTPLSLSQYIGEINDDGNIVQGAARQVPQPKYVLTLTNDERRERLEKQRRECKWHRFVEGHLILKQGLVDKRRGLFARRRMLLLTEGPHLYYVDPENMVLKGEIPWSTSLRVEAKNFKTYFVHTPNRTYYLIDPENNSQEWCRAIEEVWRHTYPQ